MNPEEPVAQVIKQAQDNFKKRLNYAECVQGTLLHHVPTGLSDDCMCPMTGFGGRGTWGDNWGSQPFQENGEGLN